MRNSRSYLRSAAAGLSLATLASFVAAAPAGAASAASAIQPSVPAFYGLNSGTVTVRSGSHSWKLTVSLSGQSSFQAIDVNITAPRKGGSEFHSWDLAAPGHAFSFSAKSKKATVNASMLPVATMKLTFTGRKTAKESCTRGHGTVYTGTLTGSVTLHTGFSAEPTMGGTHLTFRAVNSLSVGFNCIATPPCLLSSWGAGSFSVGSGAFADGTTTGSPGRFRYLVEVEKITELSRPKNGQRTDAAFESIKAPKFTAARKTLSVGMGTGKLVTGATVISKPAATHGSKGSCKIGKTRYSNNETLYFDATASSKKSSRVEAHNLLGGILVVPATANGFIDNVTLKRS